MKAVLLAIPFLALPALLAAQTTQEDSPNARIRAQAKDHSQVMHTLHILADRYGPRLTGSPNHEAAAQWAANQLTEWGLKDARLEPWDFGHEGWTNEQAEGYLLLNPAKISLQFPVSAWTPSTNGLLTASAIQMIPPQGGKDELTAWM